MGLKGTVSYPLTPEGLESCLCLCLLNLPFEPAQTFFFFFKFNFLFVVNFDFLAHLQGIFAGLIPL